MTTAPATVALDATFVLVHPNDFLLPGALAAALDGAGIAYHSGGFPYDDALPAAQIAYLIEAERLATLGTRKVIEHALTLITERGATTIVVSDPGDRSNAWLARNPHVAGWLLRPLDPLALIATVFAAQRLLADRKQLGELRALAEGMEQETDRLLSIGVALSAERNISRLHETIVRNARELTKADSGSLFLLENAEDGERKLRFAVAQTGPKDAGTHIGAVLPLSRGSISGYSAISGEVVRIDDAYHIPEAAEYSFNPTFDKQTGYRTKSVLVVPMRDHEDTIVGGIMLINRKPSFDLVLTSPSMTESVVQPFAERDESVLRSLASQAGVALENKALLD